MTTIDTTTAVTATAYSNQRKLDRCQNGVLWATFWDGTSTTSTSIEFAYSTDNGATWTPGSPTGFSGTDTTYTPNASFFIDLDDYAHLAYKDRSDGVVYYRRGTPNAGRTDWTWSAATAVGSTNTNYPDLVAFRDGTGWQVAIVAATGSNGAAVYERLSISSGGTVTAGNLDGLSASSGMGAMSRADYIGTDASFPSIDFNHTGDGKTVAGSAPHLYSAWSAGATGSGKGIRFKKATYASGSWAWGTERELDSSNYAASGVISSIFDGARLVVAYEPSTSTTDAYIRERDAADTTTTSRTAPNLAGGALSSISVTHDGSADIHLWVAGASADDVHRIEFDRSAGTWDASWTTVATADETDDTLSLKRGYSDARIEAVYTNGTGSPYSVIHASLTLNDPPTAAAWDLTDNQARDVAATLTLDWTFNDPDDGDTQGSYALRKQEGAAAYEYWNAGSSSWGASEVQNTSSITSVALASSWGADGDANHKYAVKTWDAAGLEGTYSSELTVIPSAKDNPTISSPADAGTVTAPSVTVSWSAATQTAYKARLLTSGSSELESSGWVTSTSTSHAFSYTLVNGTSYKVEVTTKNDEGLASDADTNSFSVSFTPPATPTLTATGSDANGHITVAITNPGTGATEASNDVFVRLGSSETRADVDRPVGGDGIRIATGIAVDGSFIDRAVASGVAYEYMVRCYADTGATADSAWT